MANEEHLKILKQGVKVWNQWRLDNRDLVPDLSSVNLIGANLSSVNLIGANLSRADLIGADLSNTNLRRANLTSANLKSADLGSALLSRADLSETYLSATVFHATELTSTNFQSAKCNATVFADVDLSSSKNLETTFHERPSTIGVDTLYKSQGKIPEAFLRGCGVPESLIGNISLLMKSGAVKSSSENLNARPQAPSELKAVPPQIINPPSAQPVFTRQRDQVFVSYSHDNKIWLDKLTKVLSPTIRQHMFKMWSDIHIQPGSKWKDEIQQALASAKVAVFLVSPDFLASDFIASEELPPLLKAANDEGVTILWVPISASMYRSTPLAQYQAAIDPKRPLDMFSDAEQNAKLVEIGEMIMAAMNK